VWYQLREEGGVLVLKGGHDYDGGWIAKVRRNSTRGSVKQEAVCAATGQCSAHPDDDDDDDDEKGIKDNALIIPRGKHHP